MTKARGMRMAWIPVSPATSRYNGKKTGRESAVSNQAEVVDLG